MRFKATIILTLLLIFLGLYLFYFEIPAEKKKQEAETKAKRLFSFTESSVSGLTVRWPEGAVDLEHHPENLDQPWLIVRPVATAANDAVASNIASQLASLESSEMVEERPTDLKTFGLDPPAFSIVIAIKHGENQTDAETLEVGGENLTGSEVYVRKGEGSPLYLVPSGIKRSLKKDLKAWRRRELFHFASADVKEIRIASPQRELEMVREGEGWLIKKPIAEKGDASAVSNLLGSILNLRGNDFIDDQKEEKKKEFDSPILKLNLKVGEVDREAAFYKLKKEPGVVYAVTTPSAPIYKISPQSLQPIDQPVSAFQEKKEEKSQAVPPAPAPSTPPSK